jgi:hypothetical protein
MYPSPANAGECWGRVSIAGRKAIPFQPQGEARCTSSDVFSRQVLLLPFVVSLSNHALVCLHVAGPELVEGPREGSLHCKRCSCSTSVASAGCGEPVEPGSCVPCMVQVLSLSKGRGETRCATSDVFARQVLLLPFVVSLSNQALACRVCGSTGSPRTAGSDT